nr:hypothetical protein [Acinetobacter sp. A3]
MQSTRKGEISSNLFDDLVASIKEAGSIKRKEIKVMGDRFISNSQLKGVNKH